MKTTSESLSSPVIQVVTSPNWEDYELLDSGDGNKLERYGQFRVVRPEVEAIWRPALPEKAWRGADAIFKPSPEENGGHWENLRPMPEYWIMSYNRLRFRVQLTASRHVGVFPEQAAQWDWLGDQVTQAGRKLRVLNLFGYTGLASLAAAAEGAEVTHVDASRKVLTWAHENQELSGLENASIRWILDDALKYIQREGRRGSFYDGIILDPPKFGRGPKGEVWEFYRLIPNLLEACRQVLSPQPVFVLVTAYAVKASAVTLGNALAEMMASYNGKTDCGEVGLTEKSKKRLLSMAVFSRWSASNS